MARQLRIEYAGALYHVTSRGNLRADIYFDDTDRHEFLSLLGEACKDFHWLCHAYCLMDNHYHLLIETAQPTLSSGMRFLNGVYTQRFNRRHHRSGHLFQGRFKSIIVQNDKYLLELARYIVLNPVRARMVHDASQWPWSSYRATLGLSEPIDALTTNSVLQAFSKKRLRAQQKYREFVFEGENQPSPWESLVNQIYLGDEQFVKQTQVRIEQADELNEVPKPQKLAPPQPLSSYQHQHSVRNIAMAAAYRSGHFTMEEIGRHFNVSRVTVSRAVKATKLASA